MNFLLHSRLRKLAVIFMLIGLNGCGNAILYGEGTNISIATLKVNNDPATPVQINTGLDRTVAAMAPRQGDGEEAMSLLSGFKFKDTKEAFGTLTIDTQFASGAAATTIAKQKPALAKSIMNIGQ